MAAVLPDGLVEEWIEARLADADLDEVTLDLLDLLDLLD